MQDLDRAGGNTDSTLGGHTQSNVRIRAQGEGAVTPQETEPDLPASVRGSLLQRRGVVVANHRDKDTGNRSSRKYSLV